MAPYILPIVIVLVAALTVEGTLVTSGTTNGSISTSVLNRGTKKYEGNEAEARQDMEDNMAEASVASYSTVVFHSKPSDKKRNNDNNGDSKNLDNDASTASRSESYFKFYHSGNIKKRMPNEENSMKTSNTEQSKGRNMPTIRHFENFRADEARAPQTILSQYHYKPAGANRDENRYKNHQREDYKQSIRNEEQYGNMNNRLKEFKTESHRNEPKYESPFAASASNHKLVTSNPAQFDYNSKPYKKLQPPPGMTDELMETLLQQQPQTFLDLDKAPKYESKKKGNGNKVFNPSSFNVGYSIGFGKTTPDDVVLGRPKDTKIHINGHKSVWKQLNGGVEMSEDVENRNPHQIKIPDLTNVGAEPHVSVLGNGAQSVFYMNNHSPDIEHVPTAGKVHFDHQHALTSSNVFDFSNAMSTPPIALPLQAAHPVALPLQSAQPIAVPVQSAQPIALPLQSAPPVVREVPHAPYTLKPKGRGFDMMNFYQSMGYTGPIPVYIPGMNGDGHMVQAIVIPLESLNNIPVNWGNLANSFTNEIPSPPTKLEPIAHDKPPKRFPKNHRSKPKDTIKSSSTYQATSSITVPPITITRRPYNLQREQASLNAILAKEMSRKNQRHTPIGLRPPPAQYS